MTKQYKKINNLPLLKETRKYLRSNLTPAEAKLWTYLKKSQLEGRKFRRQHSVLNFILDFYCPSEKLAVELDGQGHSEKEQAIYDSGRSNVLEDYGIRVIRFENKDVFERPAWVLDMIRKFFPGLPPPTPPSQEGSC